MNSQMRLRKVLIGLAMLTVLAGRVTHASIVVVPNTLETTEGNTDNAFPFSFFGQFTPRYQQVFAASEFASLPGPELITQIAFRPDANPLRGSAFTATISNIQINLSTTSKTPDGLDTAFANNVGPDDTVVFSGSLPLSSSYTGPLTGPKGFDIVIPLTTPFLYDPSAGNLLLDVRNASGEVTTQFDAHSDNADSISRLFNLGVTNIPSTVGLVAQFTTTPAATEVSFADFSITEAEIKFKTTSTINDRFEIKGTFTLDTSSNGIDPSNDDVVVTVGTATVTIPAGSFTEKDYGEFRFRGTIDGADVKMEIKEAKEAYDQRFRFEIKAKWIDLTGAANPLDIGVTIGNDSGTTTIFLKGKLKFKAGREDDKDDRDKDDDDDDKDSKR